MPTFSLPRWLLSCCGALLLCAVPAFAEEDVHGAYTLEPVIVTATRQERSDFEVPTAMNIVDPKQIRKEAPNTLPEALRDQAGVFVQQTTPGQSAPIIRGLIGSATLMLVDGMRLNTAIFRSAPNQYFALVDPYYVDHIEVVRETASTLYGSDAMGGVVNVITPTPRFTEEQWSYDGVTLGQYSSADVGAIGYASVAGGRKGIGVNAAMTYQNHDDLRGGNGRQVPSAYSSYAGNGSVFLEGEQQDLLVGAQYLVQPKTPRYDALVPGYGQTQPEFSEFYFVPNDRLFVHSRYRLYAPVAAVDRAELHVAFQEINDDRRSQGYGSPQVDTEKNRSRLVGIDTQLTSSYQNAVFTYGMEIYLDHTDSSRARQNVSTGEISSPASRFADGATLDSYAWFLQTEIEPLPRLSVVVGGRFSYYVEDLPADNTRPHVHLDFNNLTGSLGLLYRLTQAVHLVSNIGQGFRVPNVFDLSTLGPRPGNRFNIPNSDISPEEVVTVDAGTKIAFENLHSEIFGFYSTFQDKIEDVATGETTPTGQEIVQSRNVSNVQLAGAEAQIEYSILDTLALYGGLTYTWGEQRGTGGVSAPADRIPPLNGWVGLVYRPVSQIAIEPFTRFATDQSRLSPRDQTDPRINPEGTPGWATANLRIRWDIVPQVTARLLLENIFDKAYRYHGSGIDAAGINVVTSLEARL